MIGQFHKMYRNLLFNRLPIRLLKKENLAQVANTKQALDNGLQLTRQLSISVVYCKKRRSEDEKVAVTQGRSAIRYSRKAGTEVVGIWRDMSVQDIANVLGKDVDHVFKTLDFADKTSDTNYTKDTVIHNPQIIRDIVKISGCRYKIVARPDTQVELEENRDAVAGPPAGREALRPRPPVVCVMGHVDHGKTTLLDSLRDTSVVDTEFGGITQHIGAFQVKLPSGERVTFLDTPGHAAFAAMRARGAHATDIVVLVVAADDGVMDQTVESIRMAKEARVPIMVAINKVDKPGVNIVGGKRAYGSSDEKRSPSPTNTHNTRGIVDALLAFKGEGIMERAMRALARHGVVCEALGGDVQAVPVSALKKHNLDALVEALTLQAQLLDLTADPAGPVEGMVIEALVDPRTGKQATVLVQRGTLRRGCVLVAGSAWGKVRVLQSAEGQAVEEAAPATPVSVGGWRELPAAGDLVLEVPSEKRAGEVMRWRRQQRMREKQAADAAAIEERSAHHAAHYRAALARKRALGRYKLRPDGPRQKMIAEDTHPALSVLLKGDVDGSVEAILDILDTYDEHQQVRLELVHFGVGQVTPNDIEIAEAFNAVVYAFNVACPPPAAAAAKERRVAVRSHNVIYRLVDDLKDEISARIPVTHEEEIIGEANVLQLFHVSEGRKKVPVAGCRCARGALLRAARYRLLRGGETLYEGKLASMKHLKEEVSTIKRDMECGLRFEDPAVEVRAGDSVLCYRLRDVRARTAWDPGF